MDCAVYLTFTGFFVDFWGNCSGIFSVGLGPFRVHFWARFCHRFSGRDKLNRIRLLISVAHLGLRFGNFGKIPTRNAICLKPALLKCDLAPFFLFPILDGLFTVHFIMIRGLLSWAVVGVLEVVHALGGVSCLAGLIEC